MVVSCHVSDTHSTRSVSFPLFPCFSAGFIKSGSPPGEMFAGGDEKRWQKTHRVMYISMTHWSVSKDTMHLRYKSYEVNFHTWQNTFRVPSNCETTRNTWAPELEKAFSRIQRQMSWGCEYLGMLCKYLWVGMEMHMWLSFFRNVLLDSQRGETKERLRDCFLGLW